MSKPSKLKQYLKIAEKCPDIILKDFSLFVEIKILENIERNHLSTSNSLPYNNSFISSEGKLKYDYYQNYLVVEAVQVLLSDDDLQRQYILLFIDESFDGTEEDKNRVYLLLALRDYKKCFRNIVSRNSNLDISSKMDFLRDSLLYIFKNEKLLPVAKFDGAELRADRSKNEIYVKEKAKNLFIEYIKEKGDSEFRNKSDRLVKKKVGRKAFWLIDEIDRKTGYGVAYNRVLSEPNCPEGDKEIQLFIEDKFYDAKFNPYDNLGGYIIKSLD